ncbi:hypothetical protein FKG96_22515 [Olivibacter sp. LS-1]|uniref:galactosyltransferase-related protein n=1 Tax=Olivibacter sp. LS-1 TaxID=2592345 RepID=UPI0011EA8348|nr:galactosyltransferase-related protein [Olivibacter sp. LS-1]QEL03486.1 hypothetical protein FKG96_22515 [Olivibacter sp. LS-1]
MNTNDTIIYLSAQPDEFYFIWQLEIQLLNFSDMGIHPSAIHVLIGYEQKKGLSDEFSAFINENRDKARFFIYPDTRKRRSYPSSIRPNLIRQHYLRIKDLESAIIFYHDSDVIFRTLPDFEQLRRGDTWYVSDTHTYLSVEYIKKYGGDRLLSEMCQVMDIPVSTILKNNKNTGGAQYLLKNVKADFWYTIEEDTENLYYHLSDFNNEKAEEEYLLTGLRRSEFHGLQAWYADMWAILWRAWSLDITVKTHDELKFCWADDPNVLYESTKILHYSGSAQRGNGKNFSKTDYANFSPWHDSKLNFSSKEIASHAVIKYVHRVRDTQKRADLSDTSFLIPIRADSEERLENLYQVCSYLDKYFKTHILIAESDSMARVDKSLLPPDCQLFFLRDKNPTLHRTSVNNWLIKKADTPFIAIYDTDAVIPIQQILESVNRLRYDFCDMVYPYDGTFVLLDELFKQMFAKVLDPSLLSVNKNKFVVDTRRSCGGVVFLNRNSYISAGLENEHFKSWGPEDRERMKRMDTLGFRIDRVGGALYHLPHPRSENSKMADEVQERYMEEYFKICNMDKNELKAYTEAWHWR